MHPLNQGFLRKGHEVFSAARFIAMYHPWAEARKRGRRGPIVTRPQPPPEEPQLSVREQCERDWHRLNEYYKAQKAQGVTG